MKITVSIEGDDAGDALYFLKGWAEDVGSLTCQTGFPNKGEWQSENKSGSVSLTAWLERP
jgi:hypothetical protein